MKIKLLESGFERYTGLMGVTEFADGVSTAHVSAAEARQLSAILNVVDADTGRHVGDLQAFEDMREATVEVSVLPTLAELKAAGKYVTPEPKAPSAAPVVSRLYSPDELEKIADEKGIQGLRDIATPMGVRGTKIAALIEGILQYQGGKGVPQVVEPETPQEPQEPQEPEAAAPASEETPQPEAEAPVADAAPEEAPQE